MSNNKSLERKRVKVKLPPPKYDKTYTLEESALFQPWKVTLRIDIRPEDMEPVEYVVYVRAPKPWDAIFTAQGFFTIVERLNKGLTEIIHPFPRIHEASADARDEEQSEAIGLSEDQYMEAWKEAKTYPDTLVAKVSKDNPTIFHFKKPGWDLGNGLIKPGTTNIILPGLTS